MKQLYKWGGVFLSLLLLVSSVGCKADDDDDTPSPTSYNVTVTQADHGTVTANPTSATKDTAITLTVTPEDGYQLKTISAKTAGGTAVVVTQDTSDTSKYTFTMPESNVTVSAEFEVIPATSYTVTVMLGILNGSVSADKSSAPAGETITLTVTPDAGYELSTLIVKDAASAEVTVTPDNSTPPKYKFTMPESNVTVSAAFESSLSTPLTLEAIADGIININGAWRTLKYTKNGGELTAYTQGITVAAGDKLSLFAERSENSDMESRGMESMGISCTTDCYIYGNIMSLITLANGATDASQWDSEATSIEQDLAFKSLFFNNIHIKNHASKKLYLPATTIASYCYYEMFLGCTSLTAAPELPATTIASDCYTQMFQGCTSLTTAPELPATELASTCYYGMFDGCTSLTSAPELPATTLAYHCYNQMFQGCTSLTAAPDLPAEKLVNYCYSRMFKGCTNLSSIKCLATDISASNCTNLWLDGVAASGTFIKDPDASWTTGVNGIPQGWTVRGEKADVIISATLPTENLPANVVVTGSFGDDVALIRDVSGKDETWNSFEASGTATFSFADANNSQKQLYKLNGGSWEKATFTFDELWKDDTYQMDPVKSISLDLSDASKYAWRTSAQ